MNTINIYLAHRSDIKFMEQQVKLIRKYFKCSSNSRFCIYGFVDCPNNPKLMQDTWNSLNVIPITIPQIVSGIGWAGFNIASVNFIFDSVSVDKRSLCFAYTNFMNGIGIFIGALLGGLLTKLPIKFMSPLLFVFLISGIGRLLSSRISLKNVKEIRKTKTKPIFVLEIRNHFFSTIHKVSKISSFLQSLI